GGVPISLYASGFGVDEESAAWIGRLFSSIDVSVDGADAATHDFLRGRHGSFEEAMRALSLFDRLLGPRRASDGRPFDLGVTAPMARSTSHQLERMCSEIPPRFPHLAHLSLGAAVPAGLASREGYAELELLSDEQMAMMQDRKFAARLRALAPSVAR